MKPLRENGMRDVCSSLKVISVLSMRSYRTMYNFIRNKVLTGGMLAVMFTLVPSAHAIDTDLFLHASSAVLLSESASTTGEMDAYSEAHESSASTSDTDPQPRTSTLSKLQALLSSWTVRDEPRHEEDEIITSEDMASVKVAKVSDMSATLSWSSPKLTRVMVYYSHTSPVLVSDKTPSASPWKMWNSKQVTIRGLIPDTTYYYKVVALSGLGTTTSAEARFKTVAR